MRSAPDRMEQALSVEVAATSLERVVAYGIESERADIRADAWSVFAEMIEGRYPDESGRMLPFLDLAHEPIGSIRGMVERAIARTNAATPATTGERKP